MSRIAAVIGLGALVLTGCADPALQQKVADLEAKVSDLEQKVAEGAGKAGAAQGGDEEAAGQLLREANELAQEMKYDEAKAKLAELSGKHGGTRAARAAQKLESELQIIGQSAGDLSIEKWYVGKTDMDSGDATLLVFWEVWCPHCKREVPKVEEWHTKYKGEGLNVVGLTRVTKSATEESVTSFIQENNLSYPLAKEDGKVADRFNVRGIPAAAVVKDGKIVWRGHPARLTDEMIEGWIKG